MAIEVKELLKVIGVDESLADKEIADVLPAFQKKFIDRSFVLEDEEIKSKISGKVLNIAQNKLLKLAGKDSSFAIGEDKKPKKLEDIMDSIFEGIELEKKDIENKASSGTDERVKKAEALAETLRTDLGTYKSKVKELDEKLNLTVSEKDKSIDEITMRYKITDTKSKVPFIDAITPIQKKGYESELNDKYRFEWDEKKETVVPKDKNGNLIPSKKSGGFADLEEVLMMEADIGGILKKNNLPPKREGNLVEAEQPARVNRKTSLLDRQIQ